MYFMLVFIPILVKHWDLLNNISLHFTQKWSSTDSFHHPLMYTYILVSGHVQRIYILTFNFLSTFNYSNQDKYGK